MLEVQNIPSTATKENIEQFFSSIVPISRVIVDYPTLSPNRNLI